MKCYIAKKMPKIFSGILFLQHPVVQWSSGQAKFTYRMAHNLRQGFF